MLIAPVCFPFAFGEYYDGTCRGGDAGTGAVDVSQSV